MRANETQWENFCWFCWKETESLVGLWCQPGGAGVHLQETWGQCLRARPLQRTPESGGGRENETLSPRPICASTTFLKLFTYRSQEKPPFCLSWLAAERYKSLSPFTVFLCKIWKPNPHPSNIIQTCCSCLLGGSRHNSQLHLWLTALNLYYHMVS